MKNVLVVLAVLMVSAVPAFAEDVTDATLSALGLGGMQKASDAEGMQVRGMSSSSQNTVLTSFVLNLFDPATGASFVVEDSAFSRSTDENAGLNESSATEAVGVVQFSGVNIDIDLLGQATYDGVVNAFQSAGLGNAGSPEPANPITFTVPGF
jgi:opacity protein-like surface antigen